MIAIYEDTGGEYRPDDYAPTALYDDGEWVAGGEEWAAYYPPGTPEAVIAGQLDGPSPVVVEVTEGADELRERIAKTTDPEPVDGETSSETDRNNDGHEGGDTKPPWATNQRDREKNSQSIGPTQATLLGVGDEVTVVDGEDDPEEDDQ